MDQNVLFGNHQPRSLSPGEVRALQDRAKVLEKTVRRAKRPKRRSEQLRAVADLVERTVPAQRQALLGLVEEPTVRQLRGYLGGPPQTLVQELIEARYSHVAGLTVEVEPALRDEVHGVLRDVLRNLPKAVRTGIEQANSPRVVVYDRPTITLQELPELDGYPNRDRQSIGLTHDGPYDYFVVAPAPVTHGKIRDPRTLIHEVAHVIWDDGLPKEIQKELKAAFRTQERARRFWGLDPKVGDPYAQQNTSEYFSEAVVAFFGLYPNLGAHPVPTGDPRQWLSDADPELFQLLERLFGPEPRSFHPTYGKALEVPAPSREQLLGSLGDDVAKPELLLETLQDFERDHPHLTALQAIDVLKDVGSLNPGGVQNLRDVWGAHNYAGSFLEQREELERYRTYLLLITTGAPTHWAMMAAPSLSAMGGNHPHLGSRDVVEILAAVDGFTDAAVSALQEIWNTPAYRENYVHRRREAARYREHLVKL